jgi:hypothetical protein
LERDPNAATPGRCQSSIEAPSKAVSTSGIDDEIVASVVQELHRVPDTPLSTKDLAAALVTTNDIVAMYVCYPIPFAHTDGNTGLQIQRL